MLFEDLLDHGDKVAPLAEVDGHLLGVVLRPDVALQVEPVVDLCRAVGTLQSSLFSNLAVLEVTCIGDGSVLGLLLVRLGLITLGGFDLIWNYVINLF